MLPRAFSLRSRLAAAYPAVDTYRSELASTYSRLGWLSSNRGRNAESVEAFQKALALLETLAAADPSEPRYRLRVQLREADAPVAIDKDGTVSRSSLGIYAAYSLISVPDGKVVLQGTSTGFKGYGVITNSYATLVGKQDAERLTLRALADDITGRVSIYFHRQPTAQSGAAQ